MPKRCANCGRMYEGTHCPHCAQRMPGASLEEITKERMRVRPLEGESVITAGLTNSSLVRKATSAESVVGCPICEARRQKARLAQKKYMNRLRGL